MAFWATRPRWWRLAGVSEPRPPIGIGNKNTGDPAGDVTFYFSSKGHSSSSSHHNFLAGPNIVGQFKVQVDGQWAPYKQCNPNHDIADPAKPNGDFECEHNCMSPPNCPATSYLNGQAGFGGMVRRSSPPQPNLQYCAIRVHSTAQSLVASKYFDAPRYCTAHPCSEADLPARRAQYCGCKRGNTTVGRVDMATAFGHHKSPPPPPSVQLSALGEHSNRRQLQSHGPTLPGPFWTCSQVQDPTTWTIFQQDGPNHLGL